jgi:RNA polymerase sigma-70 factor (ECF subfamily)
MSQAIDVPTSLTLLRELAAPGERERAWRVFLERYLPLIRDRCRHMGLQHTDAEEVSGDVLSRLTETMQAFVYDPRHCFRGWLRKVVANAVRELWRRKNRHPGDYGSGGSGAHHRLRGLPDREDLDNLAETLGVALEDDLALAHQAAERVRGRVREHTWQAFWLTQIEGRPAAEVGAQLGMTIAAVYMATSRVGGMLRAEGARRRVPGPGPNEATP